MNQRRFEKKFVGGKGGCYQQIINQIPPHRVLIEPFAGEATIARRIRPAVETVLVDLVKQSALERELRSDGRGGWIRPDWKFVHGCGIGFVDGYRFKGDEFIYADPPYLLAARAQRGRAYYPAEMTDADHARWLRVAKSVNCRVMISGYRSPLYDRELGEWRRVEFEVMTRGGTKATECLWMNYPRPLELHDYSHVGDTWRARQRLHRKIRRAVNDLISMPAIERNAMFDSLAVVMRKNTAAAHAETGAARSSEIPPHAETGAGGLDLGPTPISIGAGGSRQNEREGPTPAGTPETARLEKRRAGSGVTADQAPRD